MADDKTTVVNIDVNKFPETVVGRIGLGVAVGFGMTFGFLVCVSLLAALAKLMRAIGVFA